jgi:hypothetical protein
MKEPEIFDMIIRLNRINDKLTELIVRTEYESKSAAKKLEMEYVDSRQAARILHISPRTLAKMRANGTVPFKKVGRKAVYSTDDLKRYLGGNSDRIKYN